MARGAFKPSVRADTQAEHGGRQPSTAPPVLRPEQVDPGPPDQVALASSLHNVPKLLADILQAPDPGQHPAGLVQLPPLGQGCGGVRQYKAPQDDHQARSSCSKPKQSGPRQSLIPSASCWWFVPHYLDHRCSAQDHRQARSGCTTTWSQGPGALQSALSVRVSGDGYCAWGQLRTGAVLGLQADACASYVLKPRTRQQLPKCTTQRGGNVREAAAEQATAITHRPGMVSQHHL